MKKVKKVKKLKAKARKVVTKRKVKKVNRLFPGLPGYKGPQRGWFGMIHHGKLFEHTSENMRNRVDYINAHKPNSEIETRLSHLIYLGPALNKMLTAANRKYAEDMHLNTEPRYNPDVTKPVIAYCTKRIKSFRWNENLSSLVHKNGSRFTG